MNRLFSASITTNMICSKSLPTVLIQNQLLALSGACSRVSVLSFALARPNYYLNLATDTLPPWIC